MWLPLPTAQKCISWTQVLPSYFGDIWIENLCSTDCAAELPHEVSVHTPDCSIPSRVQLSIMMFQLILSPSITAYKPKITT